MISIKRGTEPVQLKTIRRKKLKLAIEAFNKSGSASADLTKSLTGYNAKAVKKALFKAQHKKCAWCERVTDFSGSPIDHFRPKDGAWRHLPGNAPIVDQGHYWWLTWTWSNLLFSCVRCNNTGHKANYFPLASGSVAVAAPTQPIPGTTISVDMSKEKNLLVDPAGGSDPLDHIEWRPVDPAVAPKLWSWEPKEKSVPGFVTIGILRLSELADYVSNHVRKVLLPSIEEIRIHLAGGRIPEARNRWAQLIGDTLAPDSEMSGVTWCALQYLLPEAERVLHGFMVATRPGS